jgi:hypothetical protein
MKGFIGIKDNEWFGFLSQQPEIGEVNFLLIQSAIIPAGGGLDISWRSQIKRRLIMARRRALD